MWEMIRNKDKVKSDSDWHFSKLMCLCAYMLMCMVKFVEIVKEGSVFSI